MSDFRAIAITVGDMRPGDRFAADGRELADPEYIVMSDPELNDNGELLAKVQYRDGGIGLRCWPSSEFSIIVHRSVEADGATKVD